MKDTKGNGQKRPLQQAAKGPQNAAIEAPPAKRQAQQDNQQVVCGYCKKPGHIQRNCRRANKQCYGCGSADHMLDDCPLKRNKNAFPALPAPPVPPMRGNQGPAGRGAPLPSQQDAFNRTPHGTGIGRGRGQAYNMKGKEVATSAGFGTGNISVHSNSVISQLDSEASRLSVTRRSGFGTRGQYPRTLSSVDRLISW